MPAAAICRNLQPTTARLNALLDQLHLLTYTREQAQVAQAWILYGDWSFRGASPTLEMSDFLPSKDKIETLRTTLSQRFVVLTFEEFDDHLKRSFTSGYDKARAEVGERNQTWYQSGSKNLPSQLKKELSSDMTEIVNKANDLFTKHGLGRMLSFEATK